MLIKFIFYFFGRLASAPGTNRMQSLKTLISCVSLHGQTLTEVRHAQDKVSTVPGTLLILFFVL
jgi:hypothetical protein